MYYITIQNFYYSTQLNAPQNGPMIDRFGDKQIFENLIQAKKFLFSFDINVKVSNQTFTLPQGYLLDHGEYAPPLYTIRKIRTTKSGE